jgi:hypothetical protein
LLGRTLAGDKYESWLKPLPLEVAAMLFGFSGDFSENFTD